MSIESVMPFNHLILCCHLLRLPSIFSRTRAFSSESALHIRWPKYWSFSFSTGPSKEFSGLISLRLTGLICLQSKGLSRVFSSSTFQKQPFLFQGIFPSQGSNPGLLYYKQIIYHLSHQRSSFKCHHSPCKLTPQQRFT